MLYWCSNHSAIANCSIIYCHCDCDMGALTTQPSGSREARPYHLAIRSLRYSPLPLSHRSPRCSPLPLSHQVPEKLVLTTQPSGLPDTRPYHSVLSVFCIFAYVSNHGTHKIPLQNSPHISVCNSILLYSKRFFSHNVLICLSKLLGQRRWIVGLDKTFILSYHMINSDCKS